MLKKLVAACLLPAAAVAFSPVQNDNKYQAHVDLTQIKEQKVEVSIVVPMLQQEEVIYNMPKIVPGTYSVYDFGRYVHNFVALNSLGDTLPTKQLNDNQWQISDAGQLYKINYWSSASFNEEKSPIFAPAGSNISEDVFLMNNFSFFGYLEGFKDLPYTLHVKKPNEFYGVTALNRVKNTDSVDVFRTENYFELHDCPILYSKPDTASTQVAGIPITIGVYSKQGYLKAAEIRDALIPVFEAAASYLNDTLPASKYVVLIYGLDVQMAMRGTGALEHHTSTVLTAPDVLPDVLKMFSNNGDPMQLFRDIVAHEFFHIVTPLNIHAKQINDFDFINPQMSEHLWLYEGITEYNSMISQARGGIFTFDGFLEEVKSKLNQSERYTKGVSFTQMSKYALSFYESEYGNVYQKGALIGMATDLKLRSLSNGDFGLVDLLEKMWTVYGADTFFVDQDLFDIMASYSYPEMKEFWVRHVAGAEPLPLEELLAEVGVEYIAEETQTRVNLGDLKVVFSEKVQGLYVYDFTESDPFIQELGLQKQDVIVAINGEEIVISTDENKFNGRDQYINFRENVQEKDKVTFLVKRKIAEDEFETVKLKARAIQGTVTIKNQLKKQDTLTEKQRNLRKSWINY